MRFDLGPSVAELRAAAARQVDEQAEACRLLFITPGAGQAVTYDVKRREAEAMAGDDSPEPERYPMLAQEVGITAPTLAEVGTLVRGTASAWMMVAARIEALRLGAKKAIRDASGPVAIEAALKIDWPSPSAG